MSARKPGADAPRGNLREAEAAAARWLALRDGGLSRDQEVAFADWLREDAGHAAIYAEMEKTWALLDETAEPAASAVLSPEIDALPARRSARMLPFWLAAAAAVAIAAFGSWRAAQPARAFSEAASTGIGVMKTLGLPDGSTILLNTDSSIAVHFTGAERGIRLLRGEAHFSVAKNPARPFVVSADAVAVRAVGTAFDVRLRSDAVDVFVTEGRVRVDDVGESRIQGVGGAPARAPLVSALEAGERISVALTGQAAAPAPPPVVAMTSQEVEQKLAWRNRRLEFSSTPLEAIVAEFNRYNRVKLRVADPSLAARAFGGSFDTDDPETFVHLLETTSGVVAERREGEIVLREAR